MALDSIVNLKLANGRLTIESNLNESEQIALLEAAKFQIVARNSGVLPNAIRHDIGSAGRAQASSELGGMSIRKVGAFNAPSSE